MQYGLPDGLRSAFFAMTPASDALAWNQLEEETAPRLSETQTSASVPNKLSGERTLSISALSVSVLHANLNLTDAQEMQIHNIKDELRRQRRILMAPLDDTLVSSDAIKAMRSRFEKISLCIHQASHAIEALLTVEQRRRLPEFLQDAQMFLDASLPAELIGTFALSEVQKQKMRALLDASRRNLRAQIHEALQRGDRTRTRTLLVESRRSTYDTIVSILTQNQKALLDAFLSANSGQGIHSV